MEPTLSDPPPDQLVRPTIDDEFLALMCSDEEWLRAEFDAIVAAEWGTPPQRRRPDEGGPRSKGGRDNTVENPRRDWVLRRQSPLHGLARVRSPPRDRKRRPRQRRGPRRRG